MPRLSWWHATNKVQQPPLCCENYPITYTLPPGRDFQPTPGTIIQGFLYFTDITMAKSAKLIQQQLEKEL